MPRVPPATGGLREGWGTLQELGLIVTQEVREGGKKGVEREVFVCGCTHSGVHGTQLFDNIELR